MCPEVERTVEGEVDGYAVQEGRYDTWGADVAGGVGVGEFGAGLDELGVLGAVGLVAGVFGRVGAEGLRAVDGILGSYHYGDGIINS